MKMANRTSQGPGKPCHMPPAFRGLPTIGNNLQ